MKNLEWAKLLNSLRLKDLTDEKESTGTGEGREELERDYDRILFSTPTRRLADKTQVFPLEPNDSVRTRLTHSLEVSNLARSIGIRIVFDADNANKVFAGANQEELNIKRTVPALLAAIGLAHDQGNPPFGHSGEQSIKSWFKKQNCTNNILKDKCHPDFLNFDGNAHGFRLLSRLQTLNDDLGLNLTVATLASLMKYPSFHDTKNRDYNKWGLFESERKTATLVWEHTGLVENRRHPLTYIMDACDDIAYSVIDAEDTVKKGYASYYDLIDYLNVHGNDDEAIKKLIEKTQKKHEEFRKNRDLSPREVIDMSMQIFRVVAINELVESAIQAYNENIAQMLNGTIKPSFVLIENSTSHQLCDILKNFDFTHGFQHKDVLRLETIGGNYIHSMMDMLWSAIRDDEGKDRYFNKFAYMRISENYRRAYKNAVNKGRDKLYAQCQLLCDAVAGMTDSYLISLHDELRPLYEGFTSKK